MSTESSDNPHDDDHDDDATAASAASHPSATPQHSVTKKIDDDDVSAAASPRSHVSDTSRLIYGGRLDDISDAGVADRLAHMDFNPDNYVGETGLEGRLLFGTALIPSVKSYVEALTPVERGPYPSNVASEVTRAQVGYGTVHMQPHVQAGRVVKSVGYAMFLILHLLPSFSPTLSPNYTTRHVPRSSCKWT